MSQIAFVNLPVTDLSRARSFYAALGFSFDERFSDDRAACVVVSEHIFLMLLTRERFAEFTPRPIGDPARATSVLLALSRSSREEVDAFMAAGLRAGGTDNDMIQDHGFMYARSISDPDGNVLEPAWMDVTAYERSLGDELNSAIDA
ncbi:VOC family protein [Rubellimicrobium aerolatum]|uniref:VOC family protein n=1 Tax=Rubellimicrobium aerolatum TaxID=490979 RepID=A0ABW0SG99_9RHOB|nr:VOC family protein [Rubellimicrobium aerolatum]MBP1807309.1 putative lactoylglutathione lyase [Rubellimicrobium aerolatum]